MSHLEEVTAQKEARQFPDVMSQAMILHLIDLLILIGYCILVILSRKVKTDHDILYL